MFLTDERGESLLSQGGLFLLSKIKNEEDERKKG
jgi:hypothetical protein